MMRLYLRFYFALVASLALHELDVALQLARTTGTANVLLEFLHYDRSIVLDATGDGPGAQASYRRYLRLMAPHAHQRPSYGDVPPAAIRRPLEPYFLKRADRFIADHLSAPISIGMLAQHCGVSARTLEKTFMQFRSLTPVAHVRNLRLDGAQRALQAEGAAVADVAARYGFASSTTFALEYRKRFGVSPRDARVRHGMAEETCEFR